MIISIRLYGALRDLLPRETRGQTRLELPPGATIHDALQVVGLADVGYLTAVNGENIEQSGHRLQDGDHVQVFAPAAGG